MKVHGRCHCGNIAYEAEVDPDDVGMCHCTDCQVLSGSTYRVTVRVPAAAFLPTRGQPKIYVKTADSGAKRAQGFCGDCGTPIYAAAPVDPPIYSLRWGAIEERSALQPKRQIWCDSAVPWAMVLGEIPKAARQG